MGVRACDERMDVRPRARDHILQYVGAELAEPVRDERPHEEVRPPQDERRGERDAEPERAVAACVREPFEDRVEGAGAVRELPALEVLVPAEYGLDGDERLGS